MNPKAIFIGLLQFCIVVFAQDPNCPLDMPEECTCESIPYEHKPQIRCIKIPLDTWDIQATFDEISTLLNDTNISIAELNGELLGQPQEIPAHSISTLKIESLHIDGFTKFTRIDSEAFSGSYSTLEYLDFNYMDFPNAQDLFDLAKNFEKLNRLSLGFGITLSDVPANALSTNLQELIDVFLDASGLTSIGDLAFVGAPKLSRVFLTDNNLTLEGISDTAFHFSYPEKVSLYLERNSGLTHLPQEKFEEFLNAGNALYVGPGDFSCDTQYFLHCDERMDWICDTDFTRIYGYKCTDTVIGDLFSYCQEKFGYSPLTKKSLEERKGLELLDRLDREKHLIEHKYRREAIADKFGF